MDSSRARLRWIRALLVNLVLPWEVTCLLSTTASMVRGKSYLIQLILFVAFQANFSLISLSGVINSVNID